jgi:hypothetical protein
MSNVEVFTKKVYKMASIYVLKWRKLHNEELHNFYSSPSIIRMIKSRRMRWAGHVAEVGRRGMHTGYWWECQKERDH